jgi:NAD(P)-dependent dehydrogenase (short-subunit alcohol dehydrogenase family)
MNVAVNDIPAKRDKLEAAAKEIRAAGGKSIAITADVSSDTQVKGMVDQVVSELGGLHVVRLNYLFPMCLRGVTGFVCRLDGGQRRLDRGQTAS